MTGLQEILVLLIVIAVIVYLPKIRGTPRENNDRQAISIITVTGQMRVAIVISILWPILTAFFLKPWEKPMMFLYVGVVPIGIAWSIRWVVNGFRDRADKH